ncbi:MAG: hypothetical protein KDD45_01470 [Bdellovibrionales bacterium]|nr:hypothetical protein [Bdellovibrionales bacterium]
MLATLILIMIRKAFNLQKCALIVGRSSNAQLIYVKNTALHPIPVVCRMHWLQARPSYGFAKDNKGDDGNKEKDKKEDETEPKED